MGRYSECEVAETAVADGAGGVRTVRYLRRRAVPRPPTLPPLAYHRVIAGDRIDNVTARYLGDPLEFWRVAERNLVLRPAAVTAEPGTVVVIPTPEA